MSQQVAEQMTEHDHAVPHHDPATMATTAVTARTPATTSSMFRRRFWVSLVLTIPIVVTSEMVMDWFGYELDFPGIDWVGPVLGTFVFFVGRLAVPRRRLARDRSPPARDDAAHRHGHHGGLHRVDGDLARLVRPRLLVGAVAARHDHAARPLAGDEGARARPRTPSPPWPRCCPTRPSGSPTDGELETVPVAALQPGDVVLVRSGGRVPADGVIVEGAAELDESMITGESRPVAKDLGDRVVAGTVSTDSAIRVRVEAVGDDTALAGIQRLVAQAQESRSRAQVLADRAAALLFYVATAAAAVTAVVWLALGDPDEAVVRVVTVLVISCPHALGPGHPADDLAVLGPRRPQRDPGQGPPGARGEPHRRRRSCSTRPAR